MQKLTKETIEYYKRVSCDVCGDNLTDEIDDQEAHTVYIAGGYNSCFGDGAEGELDICQHCLKEKLGKYIQWKHVTV